MICMARTLGAPLTVPAGKAAFRASTAVFPGASVPLTEDTMWMTCE